MIEDHLNDRIKSFIENFQTEHTIRFIEQLGSAILAAKENRKKIILCGNGGSASQASHMTAELMGRYRNQRNNIFATTLANDISVLTALANDYCYEDVFSIQLCNVSEPGDILIVLSTSGNSPNIINALRTAQKKQLTTYALLGSGGGSAKEYTDYCFVDTSYDTAIIQEHHLTIIHLVCEYLCKHQYKSRQAVLGI